MQKEMSGKEYRNLSIAPVEPNENYKFNIVSMIEYPVFLISYKWREKTYNCAVDGRDLSVIKGDKAYRGVIERAGQTIVSVAKATGEVMDAVGEAATDIAIQAVENLYGTAKNFWKSLSKK